MPINYVTIPGISLTTACFANKRYDDAAAQKCFSNLLTMGFRRIDVDLYWDAGRHAWTLCPAEISIGNARPASSATAASSATSTSVGVASVQPRGRSASVERRPASSPEAGASSTKAAALSGPSSPSQTVSAAPSQTDGSLVEIGPYECSSTIDLTTLTDVLSGYFTSTDNTIEAAFTYLCLNIHAAAPATSPTSSARRLRFARPSGSDLQCIEC